MVLEHVEEWVSDGVLIGSAECSVLQHMSNAYTENRIHHRETDTHTHRERERERKRERERERENDQLGRRWPAIKEYLCYLRVTF